MHLNLGLGLGAKSGKPFSLNAIPSLVQHLLNPKKRQSENIVNGQLIDSSTDGDPRPVQPARSYKFDGVDDYVEFPALLPTDGSAWRLEVEFFGATISTSSAGVVSQYTAPYENRTIPVFLVANKVAFASVTTGELVIGAYTAGQKHKVVIEYDGTTLTTELNGVAGDSYTGALVIQDTSFTLGANTVNGALGYTYNGNISRVKVTVGSNTVLDTGCNEGTGSICYNRGTGANGTIINATESTFHATHTDGLGSDLHNQLGYSEGVGGALIPSAVNNPELDALGNPLQYSGRVPYNAELVGSHCTTFDGVDDYIVCPTNTSFHNSEFELSFYVSFTATANLVIMEINLHNGWTMQVNSGAFLLAVGGGSATLQTSDTFNDGELHFVQVSNTLSGGRWIKVDGVLEDSNVYSAPVYEATSRLSIGSRYGIYGFGGSLCGVRYKDENTNWEACYPLQGTAYDVSGNSNHGTAVNITESTFWVTQDAYHYNFEQGFDLWQRDSDSELLRVPYTLDGTSIKTDGDSITGYTWVSTNPAGNYHNGAETGIKRNPNNAAELLPDIDRNNIVYADTALANPEFNDNSNLSQVKSWVRYLSMVTGNNLIKLNKLLNK